MLKTLCYTVLIINMQLLIHRECMNTLCHYYYNHFLCLFVSLNFRSLLSLIFVYLHTQTDTHTCKHTHTCTYMLHTYIHTYLHTYMHIQRVDFVRAICTNDTGLASSVDILGNQSRVRLIPCLCGLGCKRTHVSEMEVRVSIYLIIIIIIRLHIAINVLMGPKTIFNQQINI